MPAFLALRRWMQGEHKFKEIIGFIVSLKSEWNMGDSVS